jgi:hypothetical protein
VDANAWAGLTVATNKRTSVVLPPNPSVPDTVGCSACSLKSEWVGGRRSGLLAAALIRRGGESRVTRRTGNKSVNNKVTIGALHAPGKHSDTDVDRYEGPSEEGMQSY